MKLAKIVNAGGPGSRYTVELTATGWRVSARVQARSAVLAEAACNNIVSQEAAEREVAESLTRQLNERSAVRKTVQMLGQRLT